MTDDFHRTEVAYPGVRGPITTYVRSDRPPLSPDDAAIRLRCSRRTVYRMVSDGILAHTLTGAGRRGRISIPMEEIEAYLNRINATARRRTA